MRAMTRTSLWAAVALALAPGLARATTTVWMTGWTGVETLPPVPALVVLARAQASSSSQIGLTWSVSFAGSNTIASYKIMRDGAQIFQASPSASAYQDSGLSASTSYSYTVAAYDAAGVLLAQSAAVSAATLGSSGFAPVGAQDSADCAQSVGWTCDHDDFSQALQVQLYANGPAGVGTLLGTVTANQAREAAVGGACGGYAGHGFSFTTPPSLKDGQPHSLYAYAVNIGPAGANPLLTNSPKTITCDSGTTLSAVSMSVQPSTGATVGDTALNPAQVVVPAGATTNPATFAITPVGLSGATLNSLMRSDQLLAGLSPLSAGALLNVTDDVTGATLTALQAPVLVNMRYTAPRLATTGAGSLGVYYWDATLARWQLVPGAVFNASNGTVAFHSDHPSTYGVFSAAPAASSYAASLAFGDVFVYPNPAVGNRATFHIELPTVDSLEIRIYDVNGGLMRKVSLSGGPGVGVNGKQAYESVLDTSGVASGTYLYVVEASLQGAAGHVAKKFSVVR